MSDARVYVEMHDRKTYKAKIIINFVVSKLGEKIRKEIHI